MGRWWYPRSELRDPRRSGEGAGNDVETLCEASHTPSKIPSACRECGVVLDDPSRQYCQHCLPRFKDQRTDKLVHAARQVLAEMRTSANDPARSPEAIEKRLAANAARRTAALAWERENPGPHDDQEFRRDILPRLATVTIHR